MIDDSALLHRGVYDPVKARAYYLKTRKLKGRKPASPDTPGGRRPTAADEKKPRPGDQSESHKQARAQAEQRLEDLQNRLDRLRNLLSERVAAAKKRSGIKDQTPSSESSSKKSASSTSGGSSNSKLTAKQKRDAAARAHKSYEKNKKLKPSTAADPTVNEQIKKVEAQIRNIRDQLKKAAADARKNSEAKSKNKTESSTGRRQ